ncbi:MAG: DUF3604 domain-containing protein [Flavobacteriaceae bacterium]
MKKFNFYLRTLIITLLLVGPNLIAQDPVPSEDALKGAYPERKNYSPYAGRNFPTQVFWGETHLHTGMSMDAGAFGARLLPEDAYRFARGQEIKSSTGQMVKLGRPLDFLVVADHSDNMGFFPRLLSGEPSMLADPTGRRWYDMVQAGGQEGVKAAVEVIQSLTQNTMPKALASLPGSEAYASAWKITVEAAEKYNEPGKFTAFIGYEWTSTDKGFNLHRVVVYRDGGDKASSMEPYTTIPPLGSPNPPDLWKWMTDYEAKTGGKLLAIAHNGNMSNGWMFPETTNRYGTVVDKKYASDRIRWEPLYEITQIKGDGETHPFLSPNDEFADYETWDLGNLDLSEMKTDDMLQYEYARSGLLLGLKLEQKLGINPYKVGFVGATDSHTGLSTAEEENFYGKHSGMEPNIKRMEHPMAKVGNAEYSGWMPGAAGYQGVWAKENTREALFDAMMRKETYGTTGPRIIVRFFGGWDFNEKDTKSRLPADAGYYKGVPMGSDLANAPSGKSPSFLVAARKDPYSGNLDRIQIVKGWVDKKGKEYEKVYDVVWSGDRQPGADGKLPAVGNTVDMETATWTNTIGTPELISAWTDPDFDPKQRAFYYARVIEIPTPRWTLFDKVRMGAVVPDGVPLTTQERAYTSPIWYTPN